ncbi:hypothetical protein KA005_51030, partial [bacterium]|nr:hypothetical protein [bacterium]
MQIKTIVKGLAWCMIVAVVLSVTSCAPRKGDAQEIPSDPGWPRIVETDEAAIVFYQPQVDTWESYLKVGGWVAVEITPKGSETSVLGSVRFTADTETDFEKRTVLVYNKMLQEVKFDTNEEETARKLENIVKGIQTSPEVIALDRVLAMAEEHEFTAENVQVSVDAPVVFYSQV